MNEMNILYIERVLLFLYTSKGFARDTQKMEKLEMGNFHAIIITNQFRSSVQRCLRAEMLLKSAKKRRKEKAITAAKLVASIRQNVDGDERSDLIRAYCFTIDGSGWMDHLVKVQHHKYNYNFRVFCWWLTNLCNANEWWSVSQNWACVASALWCERGITTVFVWNHCAPKQGIVH